MCNGGFDNFDNFSLQKIELHFLFFDKIQNFKKILSRYPKIHPKKLLNHNFSKIAFYSPLQLLVVFQKCVQYFEKKSQCFAISGISEVCSLFKKSHDALL